MQENEADLLPRPTVPTTPAACAAARDDAPPQKAGGGRGPRNARCRRKRAPGTRVPPTTAPCRTMTARRSTALASRPRRRRPTSSPTAADLQRLRDRWDSLPRWEDMTMEERRETFGYSDNPPEGATPSDGAAGHAN